MPDGIIGNIGIVKRVRAEIIGKDVTIARQEEWIGGGSNTIGR